MSLRRPKSPSRPPSASKPNRGSVGTAVAGVPEELDELSVPVQVADEITTLEKTAELSGLNLKAFVAEPPLFADETVSV